MPSTPNTPEANHLDYLLQTFLREYEQALKTAISLGHNTEYHTFDTQSDFREQLIAWSDSRNIQSTELAVLTARIETLKNIIDLVEPKYHNVIAGKIVELREKMK